MPEASPVLDDELVALLQPLRAHLPLALAVSGGADSMALMLLVARWLRIISPITPGATRDPVSTNAFVLTVDHGLRPEAAAEARFVKTQATKLGLSHTTLHWKGRKPDTGLQEAARQVRYQLMRDYIQGPATAWRREIGASQLGQPGPPQAADPIPSHSDALVTGHHLDDQAETVLLRLARGSGLDGLSAMAPGSDLWGLTLLRPLLQVSKARLIATLKHASMTFCEDPSNIDTKYERVRLRQAARWQQQAGLSNKMLALSAMRLQRARLALGKAADELQIAANLNHHNDIYASFSRDVYTCAPEELRIRILQRLLMRYGGRAIAPRLAATERLVDRLATHKTLSVTLNGCHITVGQNIITICREIGRMDLPTLPLAVDSCVIWDYRLLVCASNDCTGNGSLDQTSRQPTSSPSLHIAALGPQGWSDLKAQHKTLRSCSIPARAGRTIPAIYGTKNNELLAVPQLAHIDPALLGPSQAGRAVYTVAKTPAWLNHADT